MRIPEIRDAAIAAVLEDHPYLDGLVDFDLEFVSVESFVAIFDLVVHVKGVTAYKKLDTLLRIGEVKNPGIDRDLEGALDRTLDHYRVVDGEEGVFTLNGHRWCVGDGDDGGAVRMNGTHEARVWVRTWWEKA